MFPLLAHNRFPILLFLCSLFLLSQVLFPQHDSSAALPTQAQSLPATVASPTHELSLPDQTKVLVSDTDETAETHQRLVAQGGTMLVDYGAFSLWHVPTAPMQSASLAALTTLPGVTAPADMDTIFLRGTNITPLHETPPTVAATLQQQRIDDHQFWMVQFIGPTKDAWLDDIQQLGLEIVSYMPNYAYVVWGDGDTLAQLDQLARDADYIQWTGGYHPAYRLEPALGASLQDTSTLASSMLDVSVQIYTTPATPDTLQHLRDMAGHIYQQPAAVAGYTIISLQLPADQIETVAAWADVFNVESWEAPQKLDEIQGQIMAGNVLTKTRYVTPTNPITGEGTFVHEPTIPLGPGYLDWLDSKGFSHDPADYPIIDVVDDGLDMGDMDRVLHPDFYELGDKSNPHRISSIANCTTDYNGNGLGGHGNINAGILGAYNNMTGTFHIDDQGYRRGLGISPYGRIASTKVFENFGEYNLSTCGNSYSGLIESVYQRGAQVSTNSWGARDTSYSTSSFAYDTLTRDASESTPGNQQMLHIFSAGNAGPMTNTVGTPGNAKNVLTVGATENVRDNGVVDGCKVAASDDADDIAGYSSRGPTNDERAKPDLVAPGSHIQGPASQDPGFNGMGVCGSMQGAYYPPEQMLYTWSTGTSHSAPAVAGSVSLLSEYYAREMLPGKTPSPAMIKALMVNSTRFLQGDGAGKTLPTIGQGWGGVHMNNLFNDTPRTLVDQQVVFHKSGDFYQIEGKIADPSQPLRVSLVWTDAPGSTSSGKVLVNNLDLQVTVGEETYYGNVFAGEFSTSGGEPDEHNNVEQVFLTTGLTGTFTVRVVASTIAGDGIPKDAQDDATDQDFALVITNDAYETKEVRFLQGTITDEATGKPVPKATVQVVSDNKYTSGVTGMENGTFHMPIVSGDYTLRVSAYGYATKELQGVVGETVMIERQDIELISKPQVLVQGKVSDKSTWNRPIYAKVTISTEDNDFEKTVFTDPTTGVYTVSLLPNIEHTFVVEPLDWSSSTDAFLSDTRMVNPKPGKAHYEHFTLQENSQQCFAIGYERKTDQPFVYFEDFEQDNGGYTTSWVNPWKWGMMPKTNGDDDHDDDDGHGSHAWSLALDGSELDSYNTLKSPPIDLSEYANQPILFSWWEWWESEGVYQASDIYISNNDGISWEYLTSVRNHSVPETWNYRSVLFTLHDDFFGDYDDASETSYEKIRFRIEVDRISLDKPSLFVVDDIGIQSIKQSTIYAEDFEQDDGNFTIVQETDSITSSWEWGIPVTGPGYAHSGKRVWATNLMGSYENNEDSSLVSPVMDLSGYQQEQVVLSWWMTVDKEKGYDTLVLEFSTDGGETWETTKEEIAAASLDWKQYQITLDQDFLTNQFRFRFHFTTSQNGTAPGIYLDDVHIEAITYPCTEQEGAVVIGHIIDANTGEGVDEVIVTDGKGHTTETFTPLDDSRIGKGFYQLFLPAGTHQLSVYGKGNYLPNRLNLSVQNGETLGQNLHIQAGRIAALPEAIEITLPMSGRATLPLTLTNTGALTTTFNLKEQEYGYKPMRLQDDDPLNQRVWLDVLIISTLAQDDAEALSYVLTSSWDTWDTIRKADIFDATKDDTPTLAYLQDYDSVVLAGEHAFADPVALGDILADYLDAGGTVVQSVPTFSSNPPDNPPDAWQIQGRFADDTYSPFIATGKSVKEVDLGTYDKKHPIMRSMGKLDRSLYPFEWMRQTVEITGDVDLVARWDDLQPFVATKGRVVAINARLGYDPYELWNDYLLFDSLMWLDSLDRASWLISSQQSGTLPISATLPITLSLDTVTSQITHPGTYVAHLEVSNDTPYGTLSLPISMTVMPHTGWGKLAGSISSQGYCDDDPSALEEAQIVVEDQHGITQTVTSGISGTYHLWLDIARGPFTMTVSAAEHQPVQQMGIDLTTKQTTTLDVALPWEQPCLIPETTNVIVNIDTGKQQQVELSLTNNGHATATIYVAESSLGFVPMHIQHMAQPTGLPEGYQRIPSRHPADVAPFGEKTSGDDDFSLLQSTDMGTPIPTGVRYRSASATCDGRFIYLFGGWSGAGGILDETWRYDTATDSWKEHAPMPEKVVNMQAACIGSLIYLVGGYDGDAHTNLFLIYDTIEDSWKVSTWAQVSTPAVAAWGGKLYTAGGIPLPRRDVWRYDPLVGKWEGPLAYMPEAIGYGSFVATDDAIYYVGGITPGSYSARPSNTVYRYNPAANSWDEHVSRMQDARMSPLVVWYGDFLYAIGGGGVDDSSWHQWETTEIFDLSQWQEGTWGYTDTISFPQVAMAGACADSRVWAFGGVFDNITSSITQYLDHRRACHTQDRVDMPWLQKTPTEITIAPGETGYMMLNFDASLPTVQSGTYRALLSLQTNDPEKPTIPVTVRMDVGITRTYLPLVRR